MGHAGVTVPIPASAQDVAAAAALAAGQPIRAAFGRDQAFSLKSRANPVTDVDLAAERAAVACLEQAFPDHNLLTEEVSTTDRGSSYTWVIDPLDGTTNFVFGVPFCCSAVALVGGGELLVGAVCEPLRGRLYVGQRGAGAHEVVVDEAGREVGERVPLRVSARSSLERSAAATDINYVPGPADRSMRIARELRTHVSCFRLLGSAALSLTYVAAGILDVYFHASLHPWDWNAATLLVLEAGGKATRWGAPLAPAERCGVVAGSPAVHDQFLRLVERWHLSCEA